MRWLSLLTLLSLGLLLARPDADPEPSFKSDVKIEYLSPPESAELPPHLQLALSYEGITEVGANNRGPEVGRFLRAVGLDEGFPWCAAFTSYIMDKSGATSPTIRSGRAQAFITDDSISARTVTRLGGDPPPGSIAVWKRGDTIFGHTDFVLSYDAAARSVEVLGGNVRAPRELGIERSGVFRRTAAISPGSHFRITHFTPVTYAEV